jgi:lipopolysaccharide export LptBFGC system permease protein LptF
MATIAFWSGRLMIYRTLHAYILRELLRVFLLTASALTTLMAFGGMFRPVTKQGIDVSQVMVILINLMPAMLAYAIPIAALFAAVLVYWRMSTDNELTACRAGGISHFSLVIPAILLGLAVASADLVFVNYVVPQFLQKTERLVYRDLGSFIVSQINRQERFQHERLTVTADSAELQPTSDPNVNTVVLYGLAATMMDKQDKPIATVVGQKAELRIRNLAGQDAVEIDISLSNTLGFNPGNAFQKVSGSASTISPDGRPFRVPSYFKSKPKFLNWVDLRRIGQKPYLFPRVADIIERIEQARQYEKIAANIFVWWQDTRAEGRNSLTFAQSSLSGAGRNQVTLQAGRATLNSSADPQKALTFTGAENQSGGVRVEQRVDGRLTSVYTCDSADLVLTVDPFTGTGVGTSLQLRGNVLRENRQQPGFSPVPVSNAPVISGLILDRAVGEVPLVTDDKKGELMTYADESQRPEVRELGRLAHLRVTELFQKIDSELHSRGSFALSCLTLVLLGAALGILLRGKNPLAVFVVGFVPAIILVLLITGGRQLTESSPRNVIPGIILIWAGNGILLAIVAGVYAKLLRR